MADLQPYDAVLLVSFGGPEGPDEVLPFMERVTAGRGIPPQRLVEVSRHYFDHFAGVSPINAANRRLLADLRAELGRRNWPQPVTWGNRNAAPFLPEAVAELTSAGARRVLAVLTSAYPSYSSCRQYRENLQDAVDAVPGAPEIDLVTPYAHRTGFARTQVDAVVEAVGRVTRTERPRIVFVTHSIPLAMNEAAGPTGGGYLHWHRLLAAQVAASTSAALGRELSWELAFCSRSGPPQVPWLEPDVNDRLRELAAAGEPAVVAVPFGFISDHLEVAYDLDIEAAGTAAEVGVEYVRAATAGTSDGFIHTICDALADRARITRGEQPRAELIEGGRTWTPCAGNCCPNLRQPGRNSLAS